MGEFFAAVVVLLVCALVERIRTQRRQREQMRFAVRECAAREERRRCWDDAS